MARTVEPIPPRPPAPTATEALRRIAELYRIEADIRGTSADQHRAARQQKTGPLVEALKTWLETMLTRLPSGSTLEGHPLQAHPMGRVHPVPGRPRACYRLQHRRAKHASDCSDENTRRRVSFAVCRSCPRSAGASILDPARGASGPARRQKPPFGAGTDKALPLLVSGEHGPKAMGALA